MTGKNQEICFWRPGLNPESSKKGSKNFWCWRRENSENLQSFEVLNCRTTTDWDCIRETADPETWVSAKHRLVGHATTSWLAEWAVAGVARSSSAAWKGFFSKLSRRLCYTGFEGRNGFMIILVIWIVSKMTSSYNYMIMTYFYWPLTNMARSLLFLGGSGGLNVLIVFFGSTDLLVSKSWISQHKWSSKPPRQLSEGLDSKRSNDRLGEMRRSSTQSNASAGLPARSHSHSTKKVHSVWKGLEGKEEGQLLHWRDEHRQRKTGPDLWVTYRLSTYYDIMMI